MLCATLSLRHPTQLSNRTNDRPKQHSEALTTLSTTRSTTLLHLFTTALTRGVPRPIELHAHDPLRYVGDMLAWVHQAIAAERELLEGLFGVRAEGRGRMVGEVRRVRRREGDGVETMEQREGREEGEEEEEWMAELMDAAVGGLCAPLKVGFSCSSVHARIFFLVRYRIRAHTRLLGRIQVRVQQTIRSQESSIMSYKIANLLQFYMLTMQRTIGEDAALSKALKECVFVVSLFLTLRSRFVLLSSTQFQVNIEY